jgi:hypothetical protein
MIKLKSYLGCHLSSLRARSLTYEGAIGEGTGMGGELGGKHIETSYLEGQIPQGSNQTFAQVPRTSGNQDLHRPIILPQAW